MTGKIRDGSTDSRIYLTKVQIIYVEKLVIDLMNKRNIMRMFRDKKLVGRGKPREYAVFRKLDRLM